MIPFFGSTKTMQPKTSSNASGRRRLRGRRRNVIATNLRDRWSTWMMAVVASLAILLLRLQASVVGPWLMTEWILLVGLGMWGRYLVLQTHAQSNEADDATSTSKWRSLWRAWVGQASPLWTLGFALVVLLPAIDNWIQRSLLGLSGEATELVWLAMLQYAALWSASFAKDAKQHWIVLLISSFLMLFGLSTSDRRDIGYLVGIYGLMVAWWLMARHWEKLERGFVAVDSVPLLRMRVLAIASIAICVVLLGLFVVPRTSMTHALDGFMPTSGGKQTADSAARNGVGDGDMLVAAKDEAFTFGPVDSDLFLESTMPSLYDMVSDIYGTPKFKKRKVQKAVALDAKMKETSQEGTESKKSGREFSTLRNAVQQDSSVRPKGTASRAVAYVIGRVPQHLRLESFDTFDGTDWSRSETIPQASPLPTPTLEEYSGKPWIRVSHLPSDIVYSASERIAVKMIGLRTPRVLAPSLLTHVHIDRLNREDFFGWTEDGQFQMVDRDYIPQLTVIHEAIRLPRFHLLRNPSSGYSQLTNLATLPREEWRQTFLQVSGDREKYAKLAEHLMGHMNDGTWRSVERLVAGISRRFEFAPEVRVPEDCEDSVGYFLETKRGPDYLFATTTAMLLRSVGYPCRLVSGFYASPDQYDRLSGQTAVYPEHLHTWIEVYCHGVWLPVETTPGFLPPLEHRTWPQYAMELVWTIRDSVVKHPLLAMSIALSVVVVWLSRVYWMDFVLTLISMVDGLGSTRRRVRSTYRLLQWRAWLRRQAVTPGMSVTKRVSSYFTAQQLPTSSAEMAIFVETIHRLSYAPPSESHRWIQERSASISDTCWKIICSTEARKIAYRWSKPASITSSSGPNTVSPATTVASRIL